MPAPATPVSGAAYLPRAGPGHHTYVTVLGRLYLFSFLFHSDEVAISAASVLVVSVVLGALRLGVNRLLFKVSLRKGRRIECAARSAQRSLRRRLLPPLVLPDQGHEEADRQDRS